MNRILKTDTQPFSPSGLRYSRMGSLICGCNHVNAVGCSHSWHSVLLKQKTGILQGNKVVLTRGSFYNDISRDSNLLSSGWTQSETLAEAPVSWLSVHPRCAVRTTYSSLQQNCYKSLSLAAICTCLFKALTSKADVSHSTHCMAEFTFQRPRKVLQLHLKSERQTSLFLFFLNGCCNLLPSPPKYSYSCYVW